MGGIEGSTRARGVSDHVDLLLLEGEVFHETQKESWRKFKKGAFDCSPPPKNKTGPQGKASVFHCFFFPVHSSAKIIL